MSLCIGCQGSYGQCPKFHPGASCYLYRRCCDPTLRSFPWLRFVDCGNRGYACACNKRRAREARACHPDTEITVPNDLLLANLRIDTTASPSFSLCCIIIGGDAFCCHFLLSLLSLSICSPSLRAPLIFLPSSALPVCRLVRPHRKMGPLRLSVHLDDPRPGLSWPSASLKLPWSTSNPRGMTDRSARTRTVIWEIVD